MVVLGSTGSIGVNTLKVAKRFNLEVEVLVAGNSIELLNEQIKEFKPQKVVIANKEDISKVNHKNVTAGALEIVKAVEEADSKVVVNALVGFLGLAPTVAAIKSGKKLALANKESLVVAGEFLDVSKIVPIDSEHFGLWYLQNDKKISSMTITASGGSFRDYSVAELANVTIKEALNHPNWSMGSKITIDSATMTNKLFELLEAKWLFGTKKLDAVIETKSIIHALINFNDGSTTAHIATPNMQLPIAYALLGKVSEMIVPHVDLCEIGSLEFRKIEAIKYPIWELKNDLLENPNRGVVVNAANEVGVYRFLKGEIGFLDISKNTIKAYEKFISVKPSNLNDVFMIDKEVKEYLWKI
ncbi:1-deoxy-D-xylulose-5-phosphate reductoisomerase [Arcobacter sp. FWKO B]|uniref:1-deoxy-D-xylulose-5-phosphate reductoisomerase n=1 Tax=Arcobacter sp. FWKO B TaxID=2593672 RepID=UPI0018A5A140|nr:1-deoxy-D-xylulose-5-phosphate reductoisomerase [Arcobacter sp. FWKO B]QOG12130.1 1-deoxy-D-xylulose-5-phosphate reductoisomerase [Arcobacter sp. FWKO B]